MNKKFKKFFKAIFSGIIGVFVALTAGLTLLGIVKAVFLFSGSYMTVTGNKLFGVLGCFVIAGFLYGAMSYLNKNKHFKLFKISAMTFWINLILAALTSGLVYFVFKYTLKTILLTKALLVLFALLFVLLYAFSALIVELYKNRTKKKQNFVHIIGAIAINPVMIIVYLWLMSLIVYNALYLPCNVSILGVDNNKHTLNTQELDIKPGEKLLSINGIQVTTLQDVKDNINGLESTGQIDVETDKNIYYLRTYKDGAQRYMGLLLRQDYCYVN